LIDTNSLVSRKLFYLTKGRYYLSDSFKRQIALSLSYFINITAKNLASKSASIEQPIDLELSIDYSSKDDINCNSAPIEHNHDMSNIKYLN